MGNSMTAAECEVRMGEQLRALRLRQGLDQKELAKQAGVALNAVKNLESGRGANTTSFVKVLRALGRAQVLDSIAPPITVSPLQMLDAKAPRQRAPRKRKVKDA